MSLNELQLYQQHRLKKYSQENQKLLKGAIVFSGDSLVDFYMLKKHFGRELNLINRGIAGIDTLFLLQHLETLVWSLEPKKVFLLIGTNDIEIGFSQEETLKHYIEIISRIRTESIQTEIFVISLLPVNLSEKFHKMVKNRNNFLINSINQELSVIPGIHFLDVFSKLCEQGELPESYTTDGLHLSQKGYKKLTELLKIYL